MSARSSAFTALKCLRTILLVAVLLAIKTSDCKAKEDCNHYDYMYQEMERALINDTENLFKLQQIFFPTLVDRDPQDKVTIKVCILISNNQMSKDNSTERCWTFDYSSTLLSGLITPAQLHAFESITTLLLIETAVNFHTLGVGYEEEIHLHVKTFPCNVTYQGLQKNLAILTSWFKAYTRARGVPRTWNEEDKGYVAIWYGHWNSDAVTHHGSNHRLLRLCLLIAFILLNITVTLLLLKFVPQNYRCLVKTVTKSSSSAANILWALILFTIGWNTIVYISYIVFYNYILHSRCFSSDPNARCPKDFPTALYRDDSLAYITKVGTLVISSVVYLLRAACTPTISEYPIPYSIQKICCCLSCIRCCGRSTHSKIVQTIVLWNILLFIHFIAMTTIPIGTFLLLAPARTFLVLATFATFLISVLIVITHILEFVDSQRRNCMYRSIQLTVTITLLALVIVVLITYTRALLIGANTQGLYGIIWSILPSSILSLVGWYMKRRFFQQQEPQDHNYKDYLPIGNDSDNTKEVV